MARQQDRSKGKANMRHPRSVPVRALPREGQGSRNRATAAIAVGFAVILAATASEHGQSGADRPLNTIDAATITSSVDPSPEPVKARFSTCSSGKRTNCVVDGDTFWYLGEKYRISDINTPEISQPACERERQLGKDAQQALLHELNSGGVTLVRAERRDVDRYGRKLRVVMREGRSVGDGLIAGGLAHRWEGHKLSWCETTPVAG